MQASIYLGEALLATNHADAAREELDSAVGRAEKLGLLVEQARAQYLLGSAIAKLVASRRRLFRIIAKR